MKYFNLKTISLVVLSFAVMTQLNAQSKKNPVLMTVGNDTVHVSEFETIYKKNNTVGSKNYQSVQQYLKLFVNFKLKVKAAEDLGMDTAAAFKRELAGYRTQLAKPYLTDKKVTNALINEAYNRMKTDVKVSHILIRVPENALPKDTEAAYKKILSIRAQIEKGLDFNKAAMEYSQDPSVKDNHGELGWFTAFYMVYPFETAAYNTKVGQVSEPVRTRFGYHLVKVEGKRPDRGTIKVAHILIRVAPKTLPKKEQTAKAKIDMIYQKLQQGADFESLAKQYSDDKGSSYKGGVLPPFGAGRMLPKFENAAFSLKKDGDYTKPIRTKLGWHIIKRISLQKIKPLDKIKADIAKKVQRDSRSEVSKMAFINKLKKEYNFKQELKRKDDFYKVVDNSLFDGKWDVKKAANLDKTMFSFAGKNYSQQQFAKFIASNQVATRKGNVNQQVNKLYNQFVAKSLMAYENTQLSKKYPKFKELLKEYRDGILLFDLTDKEVWSKAVKDSAGLQKYYDAHKTKYMWNQRVSASIFSTTDKKVAEKAMKTVAKKAKKGYNNSQILKMFNKDSVLTLTVDSNAFKKGDNTLIDKVKWQSGLNDKMISNTNGKTTSYEFIYIDKVLKPQPKKLSEARGLVISDYQNQLLQNWIDNLHKKYKVNINQSVLKSIE